MKKTLLFGAMAALALTAFAETDGVQYASKDGYTFENLWVNANGIGKWAQLNTDGIIPSRDFVASAIAKDGMIYVASSKKNVVTAEGTVLADEGILLAFDYATGEYKKTIELTVNGEPLSGLLCANFVDVDDFNNLYIFGYVATPLADDGTARPLTLYSVDTESGALTLQCALEIDEADKSGRVDFVDVSGDITRAQAPCVVMAAPGGSDAPMYGYAWRCDQNSDEFVGNYAGDYICCEYEESFPENGSWGQCAQVTIIPDEEFSGSLYYIDGNATYPAIYDIEGAMISSMADVVEEDTENPQIYPVAAPCGAYEFTLGDDSFLMYGLEEHADPQRNRARLCRYDVLGDMSTLKHYYDFPENGALSDGLAVAYGGRRLHVLQSKIVSDANGKLAAEILTYKTGNGMGLYRLAQAGYEAGIAAPVVNNNGAVEYFNLQGIRVDNPTNGVFIRRQGSEVSKVIL